MSPSATTPSTIEVTSKVVPVTTSGDPTLSMPVDAPTRPPVFSDKYEERKYLKHRLAIAFRLFAKYGFCEGIAGHITLRDPVKLDCFWVNPFGLHFSLIEDDDLILVDHAGKVIDGGKYRMLNYAAFAIHSEIHAARPDVMCAAHAHSTYGRAFCATGRTLQMLTQDFCIFHNDHVLYPTFAGVVLASEEGKAIASILGQKKAALLGNHGLLTVGQSIEEAVASFVVLERCCQIQLAADASSAGTGIPLVTIGEVEAQVTYEAIGLSTNGYFAGLSLFQTGEKEFGEKTYLGIGVDAL